MSNWVEGRAVTLAVKRKIRFGGKLAFPMRAIGGKCEQFISLTNHEKSQIAKLFVNSIGGKIAEQSNIDCVFATGGRRDTIIYHLTTGNHARSQKQKFSAGYFHGFNTQTPDWL
jgi:hypothetical protein